MFLFSDNVDRISCFFFLDYVDGPGRTTERRWAIMKLDYLSRFQFLGDFCLLSGQPGLFFWNHVQEFIEIEGKT